MNNIEEKKDSQAKFFVKESINGLIIGLLLMVFVFLFVHFVLGIKAFS
ncbi:hypothetical protein AWH56_013920 [Anaerobacillus isosaccharinicus]|uniref:Uncharacterized protein n=1 Tax=Anaerobacillus isosaccharinicus TaxID=1532552 RepID=A0A7S7L3N7_9BACI|nr:hypothetical protein [Anaerobacillus isosaccharinicus]MBA5588006.1 hypothetical protein [Anaerobacillus isosaccharinicus]QOY33848.1 hypothetical protein AWH56_013920 [Anaerobacillus isosaccharinicus]